MSETNVRAGTLRSRAKAHFPNVLLTLTSIIQAMALETLWSRFSDLGRSAGFASLPVDTWLQALALLLAIVVLWIYYAQLVMRLVWVPRLTDSLIPFVLGVGQFLEADTIGQGDIAVWLAPFPVIFLVCFLSWNWTVEAAQREPENEDVIEAFVPQDLLARHGPMIGSVGLLILLTVCVWIWPDTATAGLVALDLVILAQVVLLGRYWRDSVALDVSTAVRESGLPDAPDSPRAVASSAD